jgi:cyclic beta-1,2-glucan synthetase
LNPLLPESWPNFKIHYRYRQTTYHITVTRLAADAAGVNPLSLDGQEMSGNIIPLRDDHLEHSVTIIVR